MAKNFQTDNVKNVKSRTDIRNPNFNPTVNAKGIEQVDSFTRNLEKYMDFIAWARWFPDLWWDLITPETGGIRLDLDQRIYLRSIARFVSTYGVFPRGYGKTMLEVMGMYHTAIFFADIDLTMTAQTRENAAKLIDEKHRELMKFYPLLQNEVTTFRSSKDSVEVIFTSGGRIDIMANQQSSKGARRKRLNVEESALLNDALFQDVLEPIVNVPRRTIGKQALIDPEELNGQINFFTTSGFRGSSEFERNLKMVDEMAELKGKIVLGSDWQLACTFGRGETKSQLLDKKSKLSPTFFAMNYESKWVGASDGALVNINKILELRTLVKPELKADKDGEYVISMDIARSVSKNNNQSSISVLRVIRNKNRKVIRIKVVNLINLPNGLNFEAQAVMLKRVKKVYDSHHVIIDANGLGVGLLDALLKENYDPNTGETLECWDTMNTEHEPEQEDAEKCVFALYSQGINSEIIVAFIDVVESKKLQLLQKISVAGYDVNDTNYFKNTILPHVQTDLFIEEVANLKLKQTSNGKYTIEQITKRVDKDRYSSVSYGCWYIKTHLDNLDDDDADEITKYMFFMQSGF